MIIMKTSEVHDGKKDIKNKWQIKSQSKPNESGRKGQKCTHKAVEQEKEIVGNGFNG